MDIKQLTEGFNNLVNKSLQEYHSEIITPEEMQQLTSLLQKVMKVAGAAYKDGDFDKSEFNRLRNAIYTLDSFYGYKNESLKEELRLADEAQPDLGLGDMYMVDNREELIAGLDKLTLGDSIGIIIGAKEVTIILNDENDYTFIVDNGEKENNWELEDNGPVFQNVDKADVLKLIRLVVK